MRGAVARTEGTDEVTKRPSIADLAPRKGAIAPAEAPEPTPTAAPGKAKPGTSYKSVLAKIDTDAHRALKILSANEETPMGDLLVEGLNLLFRARGMPEIAVKVTPDETGKPRY